MADLERRGIVYPVVDLIESDGFVSEYAKMPQEQRSEVIARVLNVLQPGVPMILGTETQLPASLEDGLDLPTDKTLAEMDEEERMATIERIKARLHTASFNPGADKEIDGIVSEGLTERAYNSNRPDRFIAFHFRKGKYLTFDPERKDPRFDWAPVAETAYLYNNGIKNMGKRSIAHLCLTQGQLQTLKRGIRVDGVPKYHVNSIDDVRRLLAEYSGRPGLRMERFLENSETARMQPTRFFNGLKVKLAVWDALPGEA